MIFSQPTLRFAESSVDNLLRRLVGQAGIEPAANWLRANCSTTELLTRGNVISNLIKRKDSL